MSGVLRLKRAGRGFCASKELATPGKRKELGVESRRYDVLIITALLDELEAVLALGEGGK